MQGKTSRISLRTAGLSPDSRSTGELFRLPHIDRHNVKYTVSSFNHDSTEATFKEKRSHRAIHCANPASQINNSSISCTRKIIAYRHLNRDYAKFLLILQGNCGTRSTPDPELIALSVPNTETIRIERGETY